VAKIHVDGRVPSRAENKLPAGTEISNIQVIPQTNCTAGATTAFTVNRMTERVYIYFNVNRDDIRMDQITVQFTTYDGGTGVFTPEYFDRDYSTIDLSIETTEDIKVINNDARTIRISGLILYKTAGCH